MISNYYDITRNFLKVAETGFEGFQILCWIVNVESRCDKLSFDLCSAIHWVMNQIRVNRCVPVDSLSLPKAIIRSDANQYRAAIFPFRNRAPSSTCHQSCVYEAPRSTWASVGSSAVSLASEAFLSSAESEPFQRIFNIKQWYTALVSANGECSQSAMNKRSSSNINRTRVICSLYIECFWLKHDGFF